MFPLRIFPRWRNTHSTWGLQYVYRGKARRLTLPAAIWVELHKRDARAHEAYRREAARDWRPADSTAEFYPGE